MLSKWHCCRYDLGSKEMRDMAKKLHSSKDPNRESKADEDISWMKEMMMKPHLVNISHHEINFCLFLESAEAINSYAKFERNF